ncbi:hypothetical protein [Achromobacter xylosoxidans]|uniref:hypothetical protein n=1 Tax=Alcaligenes xylosoxydans xylosoxydans TaxID=85698 RepID=UPI0038FBF9C7
MQTDRELLELAAKAAGLTAHRYCEPWKAMAQYDEVESGFFGRSWDPLTDDGDALRLAVKLNICLEFTHCEDDAPVIYCGRAEDRRYWPMSAKFPDANAATRRAIVRAAAAIGKEM